MQTKSFFPSLQKVSQDTIALLLATVIAAYLISQSPDLKKLVKENSVR